MKRAVASGFAGVFFGLGLALSQMINPNKVLNFLDVAGNWDPSLALVMGGALFIGIIAFYLIPKRASPLFEETFKLPTRKDIDKPLLIGSAIFGIGWGVAGYCPGPAFATLGSNTLEAILFITAMIAGVLLHDFIYKK